MRKSLVIIGFLVLSLVFVDQAQALMRGQETMRPYGGYCRGPKWGWYGEGKHVRTIDEVRALVAEFLKGTEFTVGEIIEREQFFEVRILDATGKELMDILLVDKRNRRIRSKY